MNSKDYNYKEVVRERFSRAACTYDKYDHIQRELSLMLLGRVPKEPCMNILEVGCGTGNFTLKLKETYPGASITAFDISAEMIEEASKKLKEGDRINFRVADVEEFIPEKGAYGLIVSNSTLHWVEDLDNAIKKLKTMLEANGTIVFSVFCPGTYYELEKVLIRYYAKDIIFHSNNICTKPLMEEMLIKYFNKVAVEEFSLSRVYPGIHELLRTMKFTGVNGLSRVPKTILSPAGLRKLESMFIEEFGSVKVTGKVLLCKGVK